MPETHNYRQGGTYRLSGHNAGNLFRMFRTIDCAEDNIGNGDTVQLFDIPKGSLVLGVGVDVETAEGDTLTIDVGDADTGDRFHDGVDGNSAAQTWGADSGGDLLYSAAGVISALFNNAADAAKIHFTVLVAKVFER